jgi:hypothetical protein
MYTCPCCGYKTLTEQPPGTFETCPICYWEDDDTQYYDPDYPDGSNGVSLKEAQRNFMSFGVYEVRFQPYVRQPCSQDVKDPEWTPACTA